MHSHKVNRFQDSIATVQQDQQKIMIWVTLRFVHCWLLLWQHLAAQLRRLQVKTASWKTWTTWPFLSIVRLEVRTCIIHPREILSSCVKYNYCVFPRESHAALTRVEIIFLYWCGRQFSCIYSINKTVTLISPITVWRNRICHVIRASITVT